MTAPARLTTTYCTDEDIVVSAGADFVPLASKSTLLAFGQDGSFDVPTPWVLASASVDFLANGLTSNSVIQLTKAKSFPGGGELLAIDSVTELNATLRWPGQSLGVGRAPGFGGLVGVEFTVRTMSAQIEDACYEINERFGIDPACVMRGPTRIYDLRILRRLTILTVLYRAYVNGIREDKGDWKLKLDRYKVDLGDALAKASVRWGSQGNDQPSTTVFSTRLSR